MTANEKVSDLVLIATGCCNLYGMYDVDEETVEKILIVTLPKQSWYGDFQIILDLDMSLQLEAGKSGNSKKNKGYVQLYKLKSEDLTNLCNEYP